MTLRSLLIGGVIAVVGGVVGGLLAAVLHTAGMPPVVIVITLVLLGAAMVLLADLLPRRSESAPVEDEAADARGDVGMSDQAMALLRAEYAELLAHARAAVAAARLGQAAPLALLEGHLEERGQLPAQGALPEAEVARAYAASVDVYALAGVMPV